jgi:hypothetical protein
MKFKIYKTVILPLILLECETWSHGWGRIQIEGEIYDIHGGDGSDDDDLG